MALQCGIVGLPNVGKSTLFNCLSNAKAQAANFPFCTIEPNLGVITPRLGSMVQNGKFAACAFAFDKQLKRVDFPTFGNPTIPHCNAMRSCFFLNFGAKIIDSANYEAIKIHTY